MGNLPSGFYSSGDISRKPASKHGAVSGWKHY